MRTFDLDILDSSEAVSVLLGEIEKRLEVIKRELNIMEVCGTHTMTAYRSGLGHRLRELGLNLIAGPGCPVCVTPSYIIEAAAELISSRKDVILCSFGDMTRVPTSSGRLMEVAKEEGCSCRVVYSTDEVLDIAIEHPEKEVVFLAAGFETTIPSIAWLILEAEKRGIHNISLLPSMKLVPPALRALLDSDRTKLDGFIYPGHVSVIIGAESYRFVAEKYGVPGAVAGFEPADLLRGILLVLNQIIKESPDVAIAYKRAVRPEGNWRALNMMYRAFYVDDDIWRGLGTIPESGLFPKRREFLAIERFGLSISNRHYSPAGCICDRIIMGLAIPDECGLFARVCTPDSPVGPCMVSVEGSCLIYYKYGRRIEIE